MRVRETFIGNGLDIALLGVIAAGLGLSLGAVAGSAESSPSLIRFFQAPADATYPGVLPQDKALLLLTDPRTADAATGASGAAGAADPSGGVELVLVGVGAVLIAVGLTVAWRE
ncbi:hypothetical protein [Halobaculum gomorrense]|uniref:Uncharacterized protein n=1 Tax=Halobaculum gomorrense TaxID=43928 RepID=A0A1M5SBY4_9EURY|nr:hypothetical protein [Halobaculum gomorrense]SHH36034.1 hypothetical protein SAMN05443636_2411 [Halobaculum gomorrense]